MKSHQRGCRAPAEPRTIHRWSISLLLISALLPVACVAPRKGSDSEKSGTLAEFGELLSETGAQPVDGTAKSVPERTEGIAGGAPEGEALPLLDPGAVTTVAEEEFEEEVEESPYIRFGERIILHEVDGLSFVTKPFTLPIGRPQKIITLLQALQPFEYRQRPQPDAEGQVPPLNAEILEYQILPGFDDESYTVFPTFDSEPKPPTTIMVSDVLVVTAVPDLLEEFEDFLDLFAGGGVPQIELEAKIIEIVENNTEDYGGAGMLIFGDGDNLIKRFDVNLSNITTGDAAPLGGPLIGTESILSLGAIQDQVAFTALVEAIQGWQNVSIESRPKTVVRAGGVARIETLVEIPFIEFKTLDTQGGFTTVTAYKKVGTSLWISPRLVGSNTLSLDVLVETSQRVGSQAIVSVNGNPVEVPTIALRNAKTVVHLKPGQTLLIGGLTQEREQEIENKVPILGDIPLLGFFFRSTFTSKERQTVIFAISARIIQTSDYQYDF